ncbi:hypothetical protein Nmel_004015, partial [Mimus melanotis]
MREPRGYGSGVQNHGATGGFGGRGEGRAISEEVGLAGASLPVAAVISCRVLTSGGLGVGPSSGGISLFPPGEATPARGAAGGSRREEGAQEKRCIESFRAKFAVSARNRASAARVPACPDAGRAPRTGAAVELGLPGGGGRAAAGRPRSLRSARRSAHGKQQRGPAESRAYGGVKPETPKRSPPSPATLRSARPAAPQEAAAGTEEARARARRGGGGGGGAAAAARRSTAGPASRRAPATMNFLLTWIRWGLAALLYLQSAEVSGGTGAFVPRVAEGEGRQTAENTFFCFLAPPRPPSPPTCSVRCGRTAGAGCGWVPAAQTR